MRSNQITIPGGVLRKAVRFAGQSVPSSALVPALANILVDPDENESGCLLWLTGSDMRNTTQIGVHCQLTAMSSGDDDQSFLLPYETLHKLLATLPEGPITINVDDKTATILTDASRYKMTIEPGIDYPKPKLPDTTSLIALGTDGVSDLLVGLKAVSYAMASEEKNVALTGVCMDIDSHGITLAASNDNCLSRYHINLLSNFGEARRIIVTPHFVKLLEKVLGDSQIDFSESWLRIGERSIEVHAAFISMRGGLIDAEFPSYEAGFRGESAVTSEIDRVALMAALSRTLLVANPVTNQVRMSFMASSLVIQAEDDMLGREGQEKLDCETEGGYMEIGFNAKKLLANLQHTSGDTVRLGMETPMAVAMLYGMDDNHVTLVMPSVLSEIVMPKET